MLCKNNIFIFFCENISDSENAFTPQNFLLCYGQFPKCPLSIQWMNKIGHKSTEYLNRVTTFIDRKLSKMCHHEEIVVFSFSEWKWQIVGRQTFWRNLFWRTKVGNVANFGDICFLLNVYFGLFAKFLHGTTLWCASAINKLYRKSHTDGKSRTLSISPDTCNVPHFYSLYSLFRPEFLA